LQKCISASIVAVPHSRLIKHEFILFLLLQLLP
jgi:7,8-dihydro-6-hydroxymethylpterin-pyrophosphokinase